MQAALANAVRALRSTAFTGSSQRDLPPPLK
jgi:hypothetical protein